MKNCRPIWEEKNIRSSKGVVIIYQKREPKSMIGFACPVRHKRDLEVKAERLGVSVSHILNNLVKEYLSEQEKT